MEVNRSTSGWLNGRVFPDPKTEHGDWHISYTPSLTSLPTNLTIKKLNSSKYPFQNNI